MPEHERGEKDKPESSEERRKRESGEWKYDKEGMNKDRGCTDILFLIIFIAFVIAMAVITGYGYKEGNWRKLIAGTDSDMRICGFDKGLEEYPYLFLTDLKV